MPVYSYVAINKQGKEKKGSFEADSIEDVRKMLRLEEVSHFRFMSKAQ